MQYNINDLNSYTVRVYYQFLNHIIITLVNVYVFHCHPTVLWHDRPRLNVFRQPVVLTLVYLGTSTAPFLIHWRARFKHRDISRSVGRKKIKITPTSLQCNRSVDVLVLHWLTWNGITMESLTGNPLTDLNTRATRIWMRLIWCTMTTQKREKCVYHNGRSHRCRITRTRSGDGYVVGRERAGVRVHSTVKNLIKYHRGWTGRPITLDSGEQVTSLSHSHARGPRRWTPLVGLYTRVYTLMDCKWYI